MADSGVENVNGDVDALLALGQLRRVLAQVEVGFSNSRIEAFWRSLKHNWMFLNELQSVAAVERLVGFYVQQHNTVMPHAAFAGHTPNEMYFGTGNDLAAQLSERRAEARLARMATNRATACAACIADTSPPKFIAHSSMSQLHTESARMSYP